MEIVSPHRGQRPKVPCWVLQSAASVSRSVERAASRKARWTSFRAGSVVGSGRTSSSRCSWWIRKPRWAVRADLAAAVNSTMSLPANRLVARGLLRPGWPEEPASDPPRLRERGRDSGDRAAAVDEAVMGSLHPLWNGVVDRESIGLPHLLRSILSPEWMPC